MSLGADSAATRRPNTKPRLIALGAAVLVLIIAMALDTKVVAIGSPEAAKPNAFSPDAFGETEFPKLKTAIEGQATDAKVLAEAIAADKAAAAKQYGVAAGTGPEFSVKFTGVVGEGKSGVYDVAVDGLPPELGIRVQTGPAINGTDIRDATGTIKFGQFVNQIEYQNAGAALNRAMKKAILDPIDTKTLQGKTITVIGAFKLINPKKWLVTPVKLDVQP